MALITVVLCVFFVVFIWLGGKSGKAVASVDGIDCEVGERLEYHVHAQLTIFINGEAQTVPKNTGIRSDCIFWLHTHDDTGLMHIEAPSKRDFTLGQFFAVWGQPISSTQLLAATVDATHTITATVDGQAFTGDPSTIPLADGEQIIVSYGPTSGTSSATPTPAPPASP